MDDNKFGFRNNRGDWKPKGKVHATAEVMKRLKNKSYL